MGPQATGLAGPLYSHISVSYVIMETPTQGVLNPRFLSEFVLPVDVEGTVLYTLSIHT
ncbi:hypothetical protein M5W68_21615 [Paenibacillus larvae]|uniref:hypothetical protein n=1 Tax=Paenibacillus larvae TaxID=1464 RepID=UPI00227FA2CE|nr:hypothetical protein [Paenibacillus larvae]MCY9511413.1 hypothetical protein [Paenibacillus larvae]MCY9527618.1 hypothetical protein [Paenibacillus larvae]